MWLSVLDILVFMFCSIDLVGCSVLMLMVLSMFGVVVDGLSRL